ncbi:FliM/FliN family flagellar motor switch protein [Ponticaulis koreensis]|uniref:FliM/FliN family flagellar motor switch protein n=1 Tax=Ponticaulis koreensis TaxID=1123045 RepID=UPI0003B37688|nr:FliM/FliN family flagellar motor switch protein [Ponticaulis koreensis]
MSKVLNSGALDGLTVRIEAYLGGTESTVGELEALKPGETVELDTPLNQNVELRLNGVAVARGELVAVGDRFGVRLSDLLPGEKTD